MAQTEADTPGGTCTCAGVSIGGELAGSSNLNYDCVVHGLTSAWFAAQRDTFTGTGAARMTLDLPR